MRYKILFSTSLSGQMRSHNLLLRRAVLSFKLFPSPRLEICISQLDYIFLNEFYMKNVSDFHILITFISISQLYFNFEKGTHFGDNERNVSGYEDDNVQTCNFSKIIELMILLIIIIKLLIFKPLAISFVSIKNICCFIYLISLITLFDDFKSNYM